MYDPMSDWYLDPESVEYPEIHEDDGYGHDPDYDDVMNRGLRFLPLRRFLPKS